MTALSRHAGILPATAALLLASGAWAQPVPRPSCGDSVGIVRGDTLSQIARRCDVSEASLLAANPGVRDSGDLEVGARLRLGPAASGGSAGQLGALASRTGKSLEGFAGDIGASLDGLLARNPDLRGQLRQLGLPDLGRRTTTPAVAIYPERGPPGTTIAVSAIGLPPNARMTIGAGPPRTAYEVVAAGTTTSEGTLDANVAAPAWSAEAGSLVIVVTGRDPDIRARSAPFIVTAPAPLPLNPR